MNKFELFTMIYMALDAYYDKEHTSEEINIFLSDMCPFTFTDIGSANPAVYKEFCDYLGDRQVTMDNSYDVAHDYISSLSEIDVRDAFDEKLKEIWIPSCEEYLATSHKGQDI